MAVQSNPFATMQSWSSFNLQCELESFKRSDPKGFDKLLDAFIERRKSKRSSEPMWSPMGLMYNLDRFMHSQPKEFSKMVDTLIERRETECKRRYQVERLFTALYKTIVLRDYDIPTGLEVMKLMPLLKLETDKMVTSFVSTGLWIVDKLMDVWLDFLHSNPSYQPEMDSLGGTKVMTILWEIGVCSVYSPSERDGFEDIILLIRQKMTGKMIKLKDLMEEMDKVPEVPEVPEVSERKVL